MQKTLLFVGGGIETRPGVQLAREMGLRVIVSDRNPQAPCFEDAHHALIADTYNGPQTIEAVQAWSAEHGPIHGVICLGVDVPLTVALVAEAFGLPGISPETARLAMDKLAMKDRFARERVPIPWYSRVASADHLKTLQAQQPRPLVIKPVDSRGARGVQRLTPEMDLEKTFDYALQFSPTQRVMAEHYLSGPQISTESLVIDGVAHTPGFSDRNYELLETYAPYFIENGGDLPGHADEPTRDRVKALIQKAAQALGVQNGVVKGDVVVHNGQPHIIEIAARLSGGYFCTHSIPLNTGVELVRFAIMQALGETVDPGWLAAKTNQCVCQRYFIPQPGEVVSIQGFNEVSALEYVVWCELRTAVGETIAPIENHPGRAGVLMTIGQTPEQARTRAENAVKQIQIITRPPSPS